MTEDCFFQTRTGCIALTDKLCLEGTCPFYTTGSMLLKKQEKSRRRLDDLGRHDLVKKYNLGGLGDET